MVSNVYFVTLQEFVVACSDTHLNLCQCFGNLRRLSVSDILLDGVELFSCGVTGVSYCMYRYQVSAC